MAISFFFMTPSILPSTAPSQAKEYSCSWAWKTKEQLEAWEMLRRRDGQKKKPSHSSTFNILLQNKHQ
jgi:hypothetical protein